jgi:hypothetical protein
MIEVLLSRAEERYCQEMAKAINDNKKALGKTSSFRGTDPDKSRFDALRSECAVAKVLGLPYTVEIYAGGDGGVDLWLNELTSLGRSVQVKWRGEPEKDLATDGLNFHHDLKADIYVLTWPGVGRKIVLAGYCTKADFIKRILARPPDRMLGLKYAYKWQDLKPIEDLINIVTGQQPIEAAS